MRASSSIDTAKAKAAARRARRAHRRRRRRPTSSAALCRSMPEDMGGPKGFRTLRSILASRQGARGRRPCRLRRRRDAGAGARRRRTGRGRLRAAAGGDLHGRGGQARRARGLGRGAEQRLGRADDGRQGGDRRRLRQGQARGLAQAQSTTGSRQFNRAARRNRPVSSRERQLHAVHDLAESARPPRPHRRRRVQNPRSQAAGDLARRRRRLRHEGRGLSGRRAGALGLAPLSAAAR